MAKPTDTERDLHGRLLADSSTASAEAFDLFLDPTIKHLTIRYGKNVLVEEGDIWNASCDAIINYTLRPKTYDPEKGGLTGFLKLVADRDLQNLIDKRVRRRSNEDREVEVVELSASDGNRSSEGLQSQEHHYDLEQILAKIDQIVTDSVDRRIARMMLENVRNTEEYALVLGVESMPNDEKRAFVKRTKDRLQKQLQRADWDGIATEFLEKT